MSVCAALHSAGCRGGIPGRFADYDLRYPFHVDREFSETIVVNYGTPYCRRVPSLEAQLQSLLAAVTDSELQRVVDSFCPGAVAASFTRPILFVSPGNNEVLYPPTPSSLFHRHREDGPIGPRTEDVNAPLTYYLALSTACYGTSFPVAGVSLSDVRNLETEYNRGATHLDARVLEALDGWGISYSEEGKFWTKGNITLFRRAADEVVFHGTFLHYSSGDETPRVSFVESQEPIVHYRFREVWELESCIADEFRLAPERRPN